MNELLLKPPFWFAVVFAAGFAGLAFGLKLLTWSGAVSTFLVGVVIFGLGGGGFAVPLLTFFLTSSLLSKIAKAYRPNADAADAKGATRDAAQVWANGGVAVFMVLLFAAYVSHSPLTVSRYYMMLFLAALATVNADTWATEIGKLSGIAPRSLRTWKSVPPGTSGAISLPGTLGAFAGAVLIPLSALLLWTNLTLAEIVAVAWAGFLGSLIDSVLGATVQAQYRDPNTGDTTEKLTLNGQPTAFVRGLIWCNNDVVNFAASVGGAICAWVLLRYGAYLFF